MPPIPELDVLMSLAEQFKHSNAEDERGQLPGYFVETSAWRNLLSGDKDIIKGAKGTGKSALYALLRRQSPELLATRNILVVEAERPLGTPLFETALKARSASDGVLTYEQFQGLWDRYFLALIVATLREKAKTTESIRAKLHQAPAYRHLVKALVRAGLLPEQAASVTLADVVSRVFKSMKVGAQLGPLKLTVEQAGNKSRAGKGRAMEISDPIRLVNDVLVAADLDVWIAFDRLDDAFQTLPSRLEAAALAALLQTYLNWKLYERTRLKLFVRSDIYARVIRERSVLRSLDKIEAEVDLEWSSGTLLNMLMRRVLLSSLACEAYELPVPEVRLARDNFAEQERLFNRLFPDTVDHQDTWTWIQAQLRDGFGHVAPRDVIKFMRHAIEHQREPHRRDGTGKLFDPTSLVKAAYKTSQEHYERAFRLEYRDLPGYTEVFSGKITGYTLGTLATIIWGVSMDEAELRARELKEVGFFTKAQPADGYVRYRIAPLYRHALNVSEEDSTVTPPDTSRRRV